MVLVGLAAGSAYLTRHCISVANTTIQRELDITPEKNGLGAGGLSRLDTFCVRFRVGGWRIGLAAGLHSR